MRNFLILFCLHFCVQTLAAQNGCTDPQASNFDPLAMQNDGSCFYPPSAISPVIVAEFPSSLEEPSGLAFFADRLWVHEDGGNADKIYVIDTLTAEKLETLNLPLSDNLDWEDFAEDDENLYVGDFGNNDGNRTDLRILKYEKAKLLNGTATPQVISFSFSDQTDFSSANNANNYDCEAFFFWNGSLHLFSKNWLDFKTRHYVLPTVPGNHVAQLQDSLNVQGQITAADITEEGVATLLGYNVSTLEVFIWLLSDYDGSDFFGGNKRKISLGSALNLSQTEGLVFRNNRYGYICSERLSALPAKLLSFDIGPFFQNPVGVKGRPETLLGVSVSPNPFFSFINVSFEKEIPAPVSITLLGAAGQVLKIWNIQRAGEGEVFRLDVSGLALADGVYFMKMESEGRIFETTLLK